MKCHVCIVKNFSNKILLNNNFPLSYSPDQRCMVVVVFIVAEGFDYLSVDIILKTQTLFYSITYLNLELDHVESFSTLYDRRLHFLFHPYIYFVMKYKHLDKVNSCII